MLPKPRYGRRKSAGSDRAPGVVLAPTVVSWFSGANAARYTVRGEVALDARLRGVPETAEFGALVGIFNLIEDGDRVLLRRNQADGQKKCDRENSLAHHPQLIPNVA